MRQAALDRAKRGNDRKAFSITPVTRGPHKTRSKGARRGERPNSLKSSILLLRGGGFLFFVGLANRFLPGFVFSIPGGSGGRVSTDNTPFASTSRGAKRAGCLRSFPVARASATDSRSAPLSFFHTWRGPRRAVRSKIPRFTYNLYRNTRRPALPKVTQV